MQPDRWVFWAMTSLGSGFNFDLEVRLGAGAFVCGEETALIHSIEGRRGQPRIRPPYPTESGLWGKPTCINNVETFANVPVIVLYGADWFSQVGSRDSGGTKVFALAGKVTHTGLVEVPMGATLREVVFDIGGGVPDGKATQGRTNGRTGRRLYSRGLLDTPIDFDTLSEVGSIMGSGGMIVLDEDDCVVDLAKYFMTVLPARVLRQVHALSRGHQAHARDPRAHHRRPGMSPRTSRNARAPRGPGQQRSSLCGLGRAAPNPVLSTLRYFATNTKPTSTEDVAARPSSCRALIHFEINEKCVGCTLCARRCPVSPASTESDASPHVIDQERLHQVRCLFRSLPLRGRHADLGSRFSLVS
jgi:NADH:ubiquinone oxidoreductase subunit F (NADH-binding)